MKTNFLRAAALNGYLTEEYVFLVVQTNANYFGRRRSSKAPHFRRRVFRLAAIFIVKRFSGRSAARSSVEGANCEAENERRQREQPSCSSTSI